MKIGAYLVVAEGEGDRFLDKALDKLSTLVDFIYIWGDNTDEKTKKLCLSYPNVIFYNHPESIWKEKQWEIKRTICQRLRKWNPDWVIAQDADEVLDYRLNREKLEKLANKDETIAYEFYCVHLWNDEKHMRVDKGWGNFQNVRFFKYIEDSNFNWKKTKLHCGLAPLYAYRWRGTSGYMFKHYGYMREEDRKKKIERYEKLDPNGQYLNKEWYESIKRKPSIREFNEKEFSKKLKYKGKKPKLKKNNKMGKTYIVRNKYGKTYEVAENRLNEHVKRDGITLVGESENSFDKVLTKLKDAEKASKVEDKEEDKEEEFTCDICGKEFKSERGVKTHKGLVH
ncbi:MAG: glycosyltransferase family 2 protein [archaeon]